MTNSPPDARQNDTQPPNQPVPVANTVYSQLMALRESGLVNMFTHVIPGLEAFDFDEARDWIAAHPDQYVQGFTSGFEPVNPTTVKTLDGNRLRESVREYDGALRTDARTVEQQRMLDWIEEVLGVSDQAEEYYETGSWRATEPLSRKERGLVNRVTNEFSPRPGVAYRNCQLPFLEYGRRYRLEYVEGYAWDHEGSFPVAHAWLELNEKVIEMTWPEGPQPEPEMTYFGTAYSMDEVADQVFSTGRADPLAGA